MADVNAFGQLTGSVATYWRTLDSGWQAILVAAAVTTTVLLGLRIPW